jgi:hypothetical protein
LTAREPVLGDARVKSVGRAFWDTARCVHTREEVDHLLDACKRYQEKDDRVQIQEYEDLVYPGLTVHAFYVKYLLPIYFDVQSMERT